MNTRAANTAETIDRNFKYHAPHGNQTARYVELRNEAGKFAHLIHKFCPDSREKSLAMTKLEESVMWANAAIARNENRVPDPSGS